MNSNVSRCREGSFSVFVFLSQLKWPVVKCGFPPESIVGAFSGKQWLAAVCSACIINKHFHSEVRIIYLQIHLSSLIGNKRQVWIIRLPSLWTHTQKSGVITLQEHDLLVRDDNLHKHQRAMRSIAINANPISRIVFPLFVMPWTQAFLPSHSRHTFIWTASE